LGVKEKTLPFRLEALAQRITGNPFININSLNKKEQMDRESI
jgi:hypothetical protein